MEQTANQSPMSNNPKDVGLLWKTLHGEYTMATMKVDLLVRTFLNLPKPVETTCGSISAEVMG